MSTVLVLAEGPELEALLGDLVLFAGFSPLFLRDDETATDAMVRRHPDLVLLDAALPSLERGSCETAARTSGVAIVYFASSMGAGELRSFAEQRGTPYFPLPNGPKLLRSTLSAALAAGGPDADVLPSVPPEILTALRNIVTSRRLVADVESLRQRTAETRADMYALLSAARQSRELLRQAIMGYTTALRACATPRDRALELVRRAVRENAEVADAPEALPTLLEEAAGWVDLVYYAA